MSLSIVKTRAALGTEIRGVDFSKTIEDDTFERIRDAFFEYEVILFRDHAFDDVDHIRFSSQFGELRTFKRQQCDRLQPSPHLRTMPEPANFLRVNSVALELCARARQVSVADLHENTARVAYSGLKSPSVRRVTAGKAAGPAIAALRRAGDNLMMPRGRDHHIRRALAPGGLALPLLTEWFILALPMSMSWRGSLADIQRLASDVPFIRYGRDSHMGATIQGYLSRAAAAKVRHQFDTTDAALRIVAAGFGWTSMTPLIYLKSMVPSTAVRVARLPGKPIRRTLVVAMRASEGADLLGRIRTAAITALRDVVQPQIEEILPPQCADLFRIAPHAAAIRKS